MSDDLAGSNVNRAYSLAASSLAIFTFMLVFLYPRIATGEVNPVLFQIALVVMGVATFAFVLAAFHYYGASLASRMDESQRVTAARRADQLWLIGYMLLFLSPSLILFAVSLWIVGATWFALWLLLLAFVSRNFSRVQTVVEG